MMAQYWKIRSDPQYAGYLLLFQLGSFLEAFHDDAKMLASTLGIALTARGTNLGRPVPMAGIPLHAKDAHLARLVRAGLKVVICEQAEGHGVTTGGAVAATSPKATTAKAIGPTAVAGGNSGLMKRRVTRIITRGTVVEDTLLAPRSHNYLAALSFSLPDATRGSPPATATAAMAWLDVSTGDFFTKTCASLDTLTSDLAMHTPAELLVPVARLPAAHSNANASLPSPSSSAVGLEQLLGHVSRATSTANAASGKDSEAPSSPGASIKLLSQLAAVYRSQRAASTTTSPSSSTLAGRICPRSFIDIGGGGGGGGLDEEGTAVTLVDAATFSPPPSTSSSPLADVAGLTSHLPPLEACAARGLLTYVRWTQQGSGAMPQLRPALSLSEGSSTITLGGSSVEKQVAGERGSAGSVAASSPPTAVVSPTSLVSTPSQRALPTFRPVPLPRLLIDPSTRRALELTRPMYGRRRARGCLLHTLDACVTPLGSRLLDSRLGTPLAAAGPIARRLDGVQFFVREGGGHLRESVRAALAAVPDLERTLQRVCLGRGSPRDLQLVRDGLTSARALGVLLASRDHILHHPQPQGIRSRGAGAEVRHIQLAEGCRDAVRRRLVASPAGIPPSSASLAPLLLAAARVDFDGGQMVMPAFDAKECAPRADSEIVEMCAATLLLPLHRKELSSANAAAASWPSSVTALVEAQEELASALVDSGGLYGTSGGQRSAAPDDATDVIGDDAALTSTASTAAASSSEPTSVSVGSSLIRHGYDAELDAARRLRDGASTELSALEVRLREVTGVRGLKVRRNEEQGGVTAEVPAKVTPQIEAFTQELQRRLATLSGASTKASAAALPSAVRVVRIQADGAVIDAGANSSAVPPTAAAWPLTHSIPDGELKRYQLTPLRSLKSSTRYTCPALSQLEGSIAQAAARAAALEAAIHQRLTSKVAAAGEAVSAIARAVAVVDVSAALAELAVRYGLTRPDMLDSADDDSSSSVMMEVRGARHLVVERALLEGWAEAAGLEGQLQLDDDDANQNPLALGADLDADIIMSPSSSPSSSSIATMSRSSGADFADFEANERVVNGSAGTPSPAAAGSLADGADVTGASATAGVDVNRYQVDGGGDPAVDLTSLQLSLSVREDDYVDRSLPERGRRAPPRSFTPNDIILGVEQRHEQSPGAINGDFDSNAFAARKLTAELGSARAVTLCGANMAGKSTYLRAAAHMVILAQMGSFVPASSARLSVVDRLFARVGASDDVTRDRSTFLVEMEETAAILRCATARSFVVIDEVGRGTSAVDGLALAWAVLEHLADVTCCRLLFATHVHELTALALSPQLASAASAHSNNNSKPRHRIACMTMAVQVGHGGQPVLTHKVVPHPIYDHIAQAKGGGPMTSLDAWRRLTSLSYGVHVASMAGVPPSVCERARALLSQLDQSQAAAVWAQAVMDISSGSGRK